MIPFLTNSSGLIIPSEEMLEAVCTLRRGKSVKLLPVSNDMAPYINNGSVELLVQPGAEIGVGSIVLAQSDCGLVLHRIVGFEGNLITLMADASSWEQEHCSPEDVLGVVIEARNALTGNVLRISNAWLWRKLKLARKPLLKVYNYLQSYFSHR